MLVIVGVMSVPFSRTWSVFMFETADFGMVTLANEVVPAWPVAVKLSDVGELEMLDMSESLRMEPEHVPSQLNVELEATLKPTMAPWVKRPLVALTATV